MRPWLASGCALRRQARRAAVVVTGLPLARRYRGRHNTGQIRSDVFGGPFLQKRREPDTRSTRNDNHRTLSLPLIIPPSPQNLSRWAPREERSSPKFLADGGVLAKQDSKQPRTHNSLTKNSRVSKRTAGEGQLQRRAPGEKRERGSSFFKSTSVAWPLGIVSQ